MLLLRNVDQPDLFYTVLFSSSLDLVYDHRDCKPEGTFCDTVQVPSATNLDRD